MSDRKVRKWTPELIEEFRRMYNDKNVTMADLQAHFDISEESVRRYATFYKARSERRMKGSFIENDPEMLTWFRRNFPHMSNSALAAYLGANSEYIHRIGQRLGLEKTPELLRDEIRFKIKKTMESRKRNGTLDLRRNLPHFRTEQQ